MEKTTSNDEYFAIGSLIIGIISLCAWLFPICGLPLAIAGAVLGFLGRDSSKRTMALIGLALSVVAIVLSIINAALGAYLGATGQLFQ
ncbi:MAG: hypothetical protein WAM60_02705 [Candidatus Promineifilaceae bacterium]